MTNFLFFANNDLLIGCAPTKDAAKRISKLHEQTTGKRPEIWLKTGKIISEWNTEVEA